MRFVVSKASDLSDEQQVDIIDLVALLDYIRTKCDSVRGAVINLEDDVWHIVDADDYLD